MRWWAAAWLACAACDTARVASCPGDRVGTFTFRGDLLAADGGTCPFAPDAALSFTATVSYTGDTSAALCLDRAEAQPLRGTRDGDHLSLAAAPAPALAAPCACAVEVVEWVEGDVVRSDGVATGFSGELVNEVDRAAPAAPDSGSCEPAAAPDAGPRCGVPCAMRWQLTASR